VPALWQATQHIALLYKTRFGFYYTGPYLAILFIMIPNKDIETHVTTVAALKPGQRAKITGFIDHELALKLMEMGCLPGAEVTLKHVAPLGDPLCIRVSGYDLSLRKAEAATITLSQD